MSLFFHSNSTTRYSYGSLRRSPECARSRTPRSFRNSWLPRCTTALGHSCSSMKKPEASRFRTRA
ncbi:hypothetical protein DPMN_182168 [Dreissena polymorpha]|uniref:Uncharacterized protein n=1 Tax=Dreissena polymorpha TaxID=45954 RepID=A0A9D4DEX9_DREPO|nr:hypothetical protein DPMN_182168 [Dreissena polymorpha]